MIEALGMLAIVASVVGAYALGRSDGYRSGFMDGRIRECEFHQRITERLLADWRETMYGEGK